jgi:hypothetical protein
MDQVRDGKDLIGLGILQAFGIWTRICRPIQVAVTARATLLQLLLVEGPRAPGLLGMACADLEHEG